MFTAILKAFWAALAVWRSERELFNKPEIAKNRLDIAKQQARDALHAAEAVTANTHATPAEHIAALRKIRLAGS